jgi:LEA14-like dessication related protein
MPSFRDISMFRSRPHSVFPWVLVVLFGALLAGQGCSKYLRKSFREPKVRVLALAFQRDPSPGSLSSIPLTVTLEVTNPNTFAIEAKSLSYGVRAGEETLASGEKKEFTEIPPQVSAVIDVPLTVSLDPIIRTVTRAAKKLEVSVTAYGSVTLGSFLGDVRIPFKKEFKKNLRQLIFP